MKKIIGSALLLLSINSTAMTKEALGECLMNDGTFQFLISMVQDEARAKRMTMKDYDAYTGKILSADVQTCRHASGISAEELAKIFIATPEVKK